MHICVKEILPEFLQFYPQNRQAGRMPLIGNCMKLQTAGNSGLNNRIYQPVYSIAEENMQKYTKKNEIANSPSSG